MIETAQWPLYSLLLSFLLCVILIAFSGTKLAKVAELLAIRTGLGQAITGAVFIGISTSLSGIILSFYTASKGLADLAISNSIGGIAAQTVFLAVADLTYRRANLEHSAASVVNIAQSALLIILLTIPLLAMAGPDYTFWSIHPVSLIMVVTYFFGVRIAGQIKRHPMWTAKKTHLTQDEKTISEDMTQSLKALLMRFVVLAGLLGSSGYLLAETAIELSDRTGIDDSIMGGFFTSIATSLPELVTTLAAVRAGAINLALGNIIGGNSFDVLFLAGSDVFYRDGSLFHQINQDHISIIGICILMTSFLMLGMIKREKGGFGGIGFESAMILALYALLACLLII